MLQMPPAAPSIRLLLRQQARRHSPCQRRLKQRRQRQRQQRAMRQRGSLLWARQPWLRSWQDDAA
jgi:hypothetical protein